jgi:hypothetical protein
VEFRSARLAKAGSARPSITAVFAPALSAMFTAMRLIRQRSFHLLYCKPAVTMHEVERHSPDDVHRPFRFCIGRRITLLRLAGLPGPAAIQALARAPRSRELSIDKNGNLGFERSRPQLVRRYKPRDRGFDECALVCIEKAIWRASDRGLLVGSLASRRDDRGCRCAGTFEK